jgi:hypothetical protein
VRKFRFMLLVVLLCAGMAAIAQTEPTAQTAAPAQPAARTDVYHVHFAKAVPGKAAQLADFLKTPDPKSPMPGHLLLLMHQEGEDWDYALIEHLGTKATVAAAGNPLPPNIRDAYLWHTDTFVNGPAWPVFAKAMGIDQPAPKTLDAVYVVSIFRTVPGRRDQLEQFLSAPPTRSTSAGEVLLQHLEGGPWNFLTISRYNTWQDFGTQDGNNVAQTRKGTGGWFQLRENAVYHADTLAARIAP